MNDSNYFVSASKSDMEAKYTKLKTPCESPSDSNKFSKQLRAVAACLACRKGKVRCSGKIPCVRCISTQKNCEYDVDISVPDDENKQRWSEFATAFSQLRQTIEELDTDLQTHKREFYNVISQTEKTQSMGRRRWREDYSTDSSEDETSSVTSASSVSDTASTTDEPKRKCLRPQLEQSLADDFCLQFTPNGISFKSDAPSLSKFYEILSRLSSNSLSNIISNEGHATTTTPTLSKLVRNTDLSHHFVNKGMVDFWNLDKLIIRSSPYSTDENITVTKGLIDSLLDIYWCTCSRRSTIINKARFLLQYNQPHHNDPASSMLLCIMCATSAKTLSIVEPKDRHVISDVFFARFKELCHSCLDQPSITAIQALSLAAYWTINSQGPIEARTYITMASNMCTQLELHNAAYYSKSDPREIALHKRLFWFVFAVDFIIAVASGKPSHWKSRDVTTPPLTPNDVDPESDEAAKEHIRQFSLLISLFWMMKRIVNAFYKPLDEEGTQDMRVDDKEVPGMELILMNWYDQLPKDGHLQPALEAFRTPEMIPTWANNHALLTNMYYQTAWIFLHQIFLPELNPMATVTNSQVRSLQICTNSAVIISSILDYLPYDFELCYFDVQVLWISAQIHHRNLHSMNLAASYSPKSSIAAARGHLEKYNRFLQKTPGYQSGLVAYVGLVNWLNIAVQSAQDSLCPGLGERLDTAEIYSA